MDLRGVAAGRTGGRPQLPPDQLVAAARITLATSRGRDTITAWLAPGTEVVFASIRWATQRSSSGSMIPSASGTTDQDGCSRHAGGPDLNGKRAASAGPWTTAMTRASTGSTC